MKEENILARIPRNASEELIIKEGVYWNLKVLDIRWFTNGRPTKKGVRMNIDEGRILYNALRRIYDGEQKRSETIIEEE